jgi:hypothetical protein
MQGATDEKATQHPLGTSAVASQFLVEEFHVLGVTLQGWMFVAMVALLVAFFFSRRR